MARFKGVLLDLGGVVYIGREALPGAVDAIIRLHDAGLPVRFLTNTTRNPRSRILEKLHGMGIPVSDEELFTPAIAARAALESDSLTPHLLIHPALEPDFADLAAGDGRAVVVGDAGESFTYDALNAAFRELEDGARLLALANNRSFRDADGKLSLDAGPFVAALAFASRKQPVVLGKPSRDFFHAALASMDCRPEDAVMVGDDVEGDIEGALAAGLSGILVRTGKYEPGDETSIAPVPSHVAHDLGSAVDWIVGQQG